eukprot:TRINITY_DN1599_c0_g1_i2.p1 TRINITY_DN1599_c0_g1~~TRINITY_DN1599_c0_g1_i2.p1  ORF type:complete len:302 (+),score=94.03 TRINITY_DN1599_c0_g1_i2:55-960(+)
MVTLVPTAPPGSTGAEKFVFYLRCVMRLLVIIMCGLCLFAFGKLADDATDDDSDLNFMGMFFAIIANAGYMLVATLVLLTQFDINFFKKHLHMFYYWPVQAFVQVFMGVQTLNSKAQIALANQDDGFIIAVTSIAGYTFLVCGFLLLGLSVAKMNKEDLSQFRADVANTMDGLRNPTPGEGRAAREEGVTKKPSKVKDDALSEALIDDRDADRPSSTKRSEVPIAVGDDGDFPFASQAPVGEAIDPFAGSTKDPASPYAPPVVDSTRKAEREAEDDELERMYASAQQGEKDVSASGFAAAD